jgi:opacity protein-like surface antigen
VGSFVAQVRYRYPSMRDRLVPYAVVGLGSAIYQFNDRKPAGFGLDIDAEGDGLAATAGAGVDFFIADNIALNLEAKYLAFDPIGVSVDRRTQSVDMSTSRTFRSCSACGSTCSKGDRDLRIHRRLAAPLKGRTEAGPADHPAG